MLLQRSHPYVIGVWRADLRWENTFKQLLRFECVQQRDYGMKLIVYTLIDVRGFCVS